MCTHWSARETKWTLFTVYSWKAAGVGYIFMHNASWVQFNHSFSIYIYGPFGAQTRQVKPLLQGSTDRRSLCVRNIWNADREKHALERRWISPLSLITQNISVLHCASNYPHHIKWSHDAGKQSEEVCCASVLSRGKQREIANAKCKEMPLTFKKRCEKASPTLKWSHWCQNKQRANWPIAAQAGAPGTVYPP